MAYFIYIFEIIVNTLKVAKIYLLLKIKKKTVVFWYLFGIYLSLSFKWFTIHFGICCPTVSPPLK